MLLATKTQIISAALVHLGQRPINSLKDQGIGTVAAKDVYDIFRRSRLASHPWRFAMREVSLTALAEETTPYSESPYDLAYSLPGDQLLVWGLADQMPFGLYGDQLHTDSDPANLIYIADVDAPDLFAPFTEALVYEIASAVAITLSESLSKAEYFKRLAQTAWRVARNRDSMQAWTLPIPLQRILNAWPTARGG